MATRKNRENTFRIDFSNIPKKPTFKEIHRFIARDLGLAKEKARRIQISHIYNCAFVQTVDLTTAQQIVQRHDNRHDYECNKKKYRLRIQMEDGCVHVRLHDLSCDVTDEQIISHMSKYGEVMAVQELVWTDDYDFPGLATGIRQVKMILREPIKSYICIDGENTYVTYPGQRATCRHCGEYIHTGIPCVQNKKLLVQKASVNERLGRPSTSTYAGAVKQQSNGFTSTTVQPTGNLEISDDGNSLSESELTKPSGNGQEQNKQSSTSTNAMDTDTDIVTLISADDTIKAASASRFTHTGDNLAEIAGSSYPQVALFKSPIPPSRGENVSNKHKRDDGNTTDDSTTSSTGKTDRKQNKKQHRKSSRNSDQELEKDL